MAATKTKLLSVSQLLADQTPTPPDIVAGFIPGRSVILFAGPGGDGKSYAMLDMGFAVARGEEWLTLNTKKVPVLIIDLENRKFRLRDRVHELMSGHILQIAPDVYFALVFNTALDRNEGIIEIESLAEECGAGLIILDSLVDFYGGADENSNADMAQVAKRLRDVTTNLDTSIITIHHTPKNNSSTPRGATALRNGADVCILASRDKNTLTFKQDKNRAGRELTVMADLNWAKGQFWLSHVGTKIGRQGTRKADPDESAILEVLEDGNWHKSNKVVTAAMKKPNAHGRSTMHTKLKAMCDDEVLEMKEQGKGKTYFVRIDPFSAAMQP